MLAKLTVEAARALGHAAPPPTAGTVDAVFNQVADLGLAARHVFQGELLHDPDRGHDIAVGLHSVALAFGRRSVPHPHTGKQQAQWLLPNGAAVTAKHASPHADHTWKGMVELGGHGKQSTMFPSSWDAQRVRAAALAVLDDPASVTTAARDPRNASVTGTFEGIDLMVVIDRETRVPRTIFPMTAGQPVRS
jgi:hypothetical protein